MITADPPARVASTLDSVRPYADEIVIAADSRVDEDTLAEYGTIADKLFRIEFVLAERHLAWVFAQCEGDWILRLDGDEVLSQALVERLPEMLASRDVRQFWIQRAWLYPDAEHVLAEMPWSEDFVNRLTRNDSTLRISGRQHTDPEAVAQREYVEAPLYHLDLLTASHQRRLDKVVRYEAARPRLPVSGGGRLNEAFYLPELRGSLELTAVPEADRTRIAQMLATPPRSRSTTAPGHWPLVTLEEMDRLWEGRRVGAEAYAASLELHASTLSMAPSEGRHVLMRVRNEGSERWPASLDERPLIRLSYRWLNPDGSVHTPEGPRSPFPRTVGPGEQLLAPLHVDAPTVEGDYILEVDVVHEEVRWFDCACRVPVKVAHPTWRPVDIRLRETQAPDARSDADIRIPKTIHRVWLGGQPMPEEHERLGQTFAQHHPDWEMRLWTADDLPELGIDDTERDRARTPAELANLVRYEVLSRHGGVYVDTDVECRRPLTSLLHGIDAFAALEVPGRIGTAVLGAVPGHSVFERAARLARQTLGIYEPGAASTNGAYFLSLIVEQEQNMAIFEASVFYPFLWDEPERRHEDFPDAYTIHYWTLSWLGEDRPSHAQTQIASGAA